MFVLRTGLQGNGKTLNTIKEVDTKAHAEGRTVYYCNVTGFNPGHPAIKANWVPFDTPETWFELPANAIIVIDEAQTWFRVRPQGSKVPDYASRLEIMRKDGHELHCITQSPKLIDSHMRELCNLHVHYNRGHGGSVIKRWEFQKPELSVNSNKADFTLGEATRITIDKSYFGCYESVKEGTKHHFKFRPPKALLVFVACVIALAGLGWKFYSDRLSPAVSGAPVQAQEVSAKPVGKPVPTQPGDRIRVSAEQYVSDRVPRIADVPSSAPIYDELTKPVAYPKPFCVSSRDEYFIQKNAKRMTIGDRDGKQYGCRCNSQQGSRLNISFEACMAYVEEGYFDPAVPDRGAIGAAGVGASATATAAPVAISQAQPVIGNSASALAGGSFTVVPDSEYASRPWRN